MEFKVLHDVSRGIPAPRWGAIEVPRRNGGDEMAQRPPVAPFTKLEEDAITIINANNITKEGFSPLIRLIL